jgi:hypothetical protein
MKDRILQFLASKSLSPTHFADLLKVQRSGVSHILAGRNKPSCDFITKMLLTFPGVNAEWLLLGRGEMYKSAAGATPQTLPLFEEHLPQNEPDVKVDPPKEKGENLKNDVEDVLPDGRLSGLQHIAAKKAGKTVEAITIFYSDKTFCVYQPE